MKRIGDIWISETHYFVGKQNTSVNGRIDGGLGKALLYLLEHEGKIVDGDRMRKITCVKYPANYLNGLRNQLANCSLCYRLVIDRRKEEFRLERI